jgi:hypothetical protein
MATDPSKAAVQDLTSATLSALRAAVEELEAFIRMGADYDSKDYASDRMKMAASRVEHAPVLLAELREQAKGGWGDMQA